MYHTYTKNEGKTNDSNRSQNKQTKKKIDQSIGIQPIRRPGKKDLIIPCHECVKLSSFFVSQTSQWTHSFFSQCA